MLRNVHRQTWTNIKKKYRVGFEPWTWRSESQCSTNRAKEAENFEHSRNSIIGVACYKWWTLSPKGIECPPPKRCYFFYQDVVQHTYYYHFLTQYVIKLHILSRFSDSRCGLALNLSLISISVCEFWYTVPLRKNQNPFQFYIENESLSILPAPPPPHTLFCSFPPFQTNYLSIFQFQPQKVSL